MVCQYFDTALPWQHTGLCGSCTAPDRPLLRCAALADVKVFVAGGVSRLGRPGRLLRHQLHPMVAASQTCCSLAALATTAASPAKHCNQSAKKLPKSLFTNFVQIRSIIGR